MKILIKPFVIDDRVRTLHCEKFYGSIEGNQYTDDLLNTRINAFMKCFNDSIAIIQLNRYGPDSGGYECFAELFYYDLEEGE